MNVRPCSLYDSIDSVGVQQRSGFTRGPCTKSLRRLTPACPVLDWGKRKKEKEKEMTSRMALLWAHCRKAHCGQQALFLLYRPFQRAALCLLIRATDCFETEVTLDQMTFLPSELIPCNSCKELLATRSAMFHVGWDSTRTWASGSQDHVSHFRTPVG